MSDQNKPSKKQRAVLRLLEISGGELNAKDIKTITRIYDNEVYKILGGFCHDGIVTRRVGALAKGRNPDQYYKIVDTGE